MNNDNCTGLYPEGKRDRPQDKLSIFKLKTLIKSFLTLDISRTETEEKLDLMVGAFFERNEDARTFLAYGKITVKFSVFAEQNGVFNHQRKLSEICGAISVQVSFALPDIFFVNN